jgi:hypothetical protein
MKGQAFGHELVLHDRFALLLTAVFSDDYAGVS